PEYSLADVAKHKTKEDRVWVTFEDGVYDITEWIDEHPGGPRIMQAAGGPIDPYWKLYKVHGSSKTAMEELKKMRIGRLKAGERPDLTIADEFENEPERSAELVVRSPQPLNAETPSYALSDEFITPTDLFYVRGHFPVPDIDPAAYTLEITGLGVRPLVLTLDDLRTRFPHASICCSLQCAGNRRRDMSSERATQGLQWASGAIGTAVFTGVRLRDVLRYAGLLEIPKGENVKCNVRHVQFEGYDGYGGSIDISKAYDEEADVILAWSMNGQPLDRDHGAPVRVVVPGRVAARSVKFLKTVRLSDRESPAQWQQRDYRIPPPYADPATYDLAEAPPIQELPVQSAITSPDPEQGAVLGAGEAELLLKGYAVSGARRRILRVDVSVDGGETWRGARITDGKAWLASDPDAAGLGEAERRAVWDGSQKGWCWVKWELRVPREELLRGAKDGEVEVVCKAVNSAFNVQPEKHAPVYNYRGFLANAWHRLKI
ncbi:Oxidoreductase, molybdopterin-binding domain-containing protein, partial [Hyaloraphidium curvatum]